MLRELLPPYLAAALLVASIFPAALVLQAGLAIEIWIHRMPQPRTATLRAYRIVNFVVGACALLFIVAAGLVSIRFASKALTPKPQMGVPTGWDAAPS